MKKYFIILLLFTLASQAQTVKDTLFFDYKKAMYEQVVNEELKKLISLNIKIKEGVNLKNDDLLVTNYESNIDVVSLPIFDFKKEIIAFKDGDNLISFINFKNDFSNQEMLVYQDKDLIYLQKLEDIDYGAIEKNYKDNFYKINDLVLKKNNFKRWYLSLFDFPILLQDCFYFKILDEYCMVMNGRVYVLVNEWDYITLREFNIFFVRRIGEIIKKVNGSKETTFHMDDDRSQPESMIFLSIKND